jgi:hypothetical protein
MKQRTSSLLPRQIASAPFAAADALARMMLDASPYARYQRPQVPPMPQVPEEAPPPPFEDLAPPIPEPAETSVSLQVQQLRNEIEALRASIDSGSVAIPGGIPARNAPKKKAKAPRKRRS